MFLQDDVQRTVDAATRTQAQTLLQELNSGVFHRPATSSATASAAVMTTIPEARLTIVPRGSRLPTGGSQVTQPLVSALTQLALAPGAVVKLEDETYLGLADAVMWFHVCPFSPLATGARLCPF